MDHSEAVKMKAVERYVLGELSSDVREQFEEHCFECVECANDLKALTTFVTAGRIVFEEGDQVAEQRAEEGERSWGWRKWFRPAVMIPAVGALAAIVIFQAAVTIPGLKKETARESGAQVYGSSYRVQGATRGESNSRVAIAPNESFALDFDFTPSNSFPRYKGRLVDESGQSVLTFGVGGEEANKELHLVVPTGVLHPGNYDVVFFGDSGTNSADAKMEEVQRISFTIEFRK
jgi:hypothetical protein